MKKKILAVATVICLLAIAATGTLAYFTAEGTARNVITTKGISIAVVEHTKDENGTLVDFPEEGVSGVMPGTAVSKIVKVQNTGSADAWIRVKVDAYIKGADGEELPMTVGEDDVQVMDYVVLDGWIDGGDGYYYYEESVPAEAYTDILFEEVKFAPEMGNEYQDCVANIEILAEAVQVANNGATVMEAKGWPAE